MKRIKLDSDRFKRIIDTLFEIADIFIKNFLTRDFI